MARETRAAPEGIYRPFTLNRVFFASSAVLFLSVLAMIWKDYNREWKQYQRTWFEIENVKIAKDVEMAQAAVPKADIDAARASLAAAEEKVSANEAELGELDRELEALEGPLYETRQAEGFTKAEWEAQKYVYESALKEHGEDHKSTVAESQTLGAMKNAWTEARRAKDELEAQEAEILEKKAVFTADLAAANKTIRDMNREIVRLQGLLDAISPGLVYEIRNAPVIDMAAPSIKIDQVILDHLKDNYHFVEIQKVDRCVTCHKGINNPDYVVGPDGEFEHPGLREHFREAWPDEAERASMTMVYKAHPRMDLYMSGRSPHPYEQYGCTVCHDGQGRSLTFTTANHHPSDPAEQEDWEKRLGWEEVELWEARMMPTKHLHSSCFKCHTQQREIRGAEKYNEGREIFRAHGCFGCHKSEGFLDLGKVGPSLRQMGSKLDRDWTHEWIRNPRAFRPGTRMPVFWDQSNNSAPDDPEMEKRTVAEVAAVTEYLFAYSEPIDYAAANGGVRAADANLEDGERYLMTKGCIACHAVGEYNPRDPDEFPHAPRLDKTGAKLGFDWLFYWLKDPKRYHPDTRMPSFRLSDEEARDIAAYLDQLGSDKHAAPPAPQVDEETLRELVLANLKERQSDAAAEAQLGQMLTRKEQLLYLGQRVITRYGCYGCHDIPGFEDATPIGVELTGNQAIGSKDVDRLDFGFIYGDVHFQRGEEKYEAQINRFHDGHEGGRLYQWLWLKMMEPRIWDRDKEKERADLLRMPNFYFTPEEADALVTFLLSLRSDEVPLDNQRILSEREAAVEHGRRWVKENNCVGCHKVDLERLTLRGEVEDKMLDGAVLEGEVNAELDDRAFFTPWRDNDEAGVRIGIPMQIDKSTIVDRKPAWAGEIWDPLYRYYTEVLEKEPDVAMRFLPPHLVNEGTKVQADWLFGFLKNPVILRPWYDVVMPQFHLSDEKAAAITGFFVARENEDLPYEHIREKDQEYIEERKAEFPDYLKKAYTVFQTETAKCTDCHVLGGVYPTEEILSLAPDLWHARDRLRPEWLERWLRDPQSWQPGTSMPEPAWPELAKELGMSEEPSLRAFVDLLYHLRATSAKTE